MHKTGTIMLDEILRQMNQHGFYPPSPLIPDGKIHRWKSDEKDKKDSCWYRGFANATSNHEDFFVFIFGDHHFADSFHKVTSSTKIDKHDKARMEEKIRKASRAHHLEKTELQKKTAADAKEKWASLPDYFGKNLYLEKKKMTELYGSRIDGFNLVIPMRDVDGEIHNLEIIYSEGKQKKGLYGGRRDGLFHMLGTPKDIIYVCEGFSTAVSVHLAMQDCTVCSFNSGNIPKVCSALSKKYPVAKIVVCGDNDQFTDLNAGLQKAEEAASICGGKYLVPQFENLDSKPTDFNDLHNLYGLDEVKRQIMSIEPKNEVEVFDENYVCNSPYPDENEKTFKRKGTLRNVIELLRRLKIIVRYNVISKEEEILIPGGSFSMDNKANASFSCIIDWCERVGIPTANLNGYLTAIADSNPYNPVATWIESKSWDRISRLDAFYKTITAKDEMSNVEILCMKEKLIRSWMISAVAALYEPQGVSAHGVLVLQGKQNLGKTAWFKRLAPSHLNVLADGMLLRPDDKDSTFAILSKWIVELGELDATFRKSDIAQMKAFLTKCFDVIRRPFAKKESCYPRRTVFFASVNEVDFLRDPTGNRRFWTIECEKIDYMHDIDMQQLWAEIRELYLAGEPWVLSSAEIESLDVHNQNYIPVEPIEEIIRQKLDWENPIHIARSATEICEMLGMVNPSIAQCRNVGAALRKINVPVSKAKGLTRFRVPSLKS